MEYAGALGVAPWDYSLRELHVMLRGRRRVAWGMQSCLMALLANINAPKGTKFDAAEFIPEDLRPEEVVLPFDVIFADYIPPKEQAK